MDEQKQEDIIAVNKSPTSTDLTRVPQQQLNLVKEIKVEKDEEDDCNVPKYNQEEFNAIFLCKRISRGTYLFTFHPNFKQLFHQFHVNVDDNVG